MNFEKTNVNAQEFRMPILVDHAGTEWVEIWAHCFVPLDYAGDWRMEHVRFTRPENSNVFSTLRAGDLATSIAVPWSEQRRLTLLSHVVGQIEGSAIINSTSTDAFKVTDSQILCATLFEGLADVDGIPMSNRARNMAGMVDRMISRINLPDPDTLREVSWLLALTGNFVLNYPRRIDVADLRRWGVSERACLLLKEVTACLNTTSHALLSDSDLSLSVKALATVTFVDRLVLWEGTCMPTLANYGWQNHRETLKLKVGTSNFSQIIRELDDLQLPINLLDWLESELAVDHHVNKPVDEIAFPESEVDYSLAQFNWWAVDVGFPLPDRLSKLSNQLFETLEDCLAAPLTMPRSELLQPRGVDENMSIAFAASLALEVGGNGLRNYDLFKEIYVDAIQQLNSSRNERAVIKQDRLPPEDFVNASIERGIYGLKLLLEKFDPEQVSDADDQTRSLSRSDTLFKMDNLTLMATALIVATVTKLRWADWLISDVVEDKRGILQMVNNDAGLQLDLLKTMISAVQEHARTPAEIALEGYLISESDYLVQVDCDNSDWTFAKCCLVWGAIEFGNPEFNAQVEHLDLVPFGVADAVRLAIETSAYSAIFSGEPLVISVSSGEGSDPLCEVTSEFFRNELIVSVRVDDSFYVPDELRSTLQAARNYFRKGEFSKTLVWNFQPSREWWANPITEAIEAVQFFGRDLVAGVRAAESNPYEDRAIQVNCLAGGEDFVNSVWTLFSKVASFDFTSSDYSGNIT